MALLLIHDQIQWVEHAKGKKLFEWRIWSEKDQHLELYLESSDMQNEAPLPEPLSGQVHRGHYYIRALPQASEAKTKEFLQSLFDDDEDTLQNIENYRDESSI